LGRARWVVDLIGFDLGKGVIGIPERLDVDTPESVWRIELGHLGIEIHRRLRTTIENITKTVG
jgi:hypothetical protein